MSANKLIYWIVLATAVVANIGANTAFKIAVSSLPEGARLSSALKVFDKASLWIGLFLAGVLLLSYLIAIRQIPVSIAYATVTSLAMIGLVVVDSLLFDLTLSYVRLLGIGLVILGVFLLSGVGVKLA